MKKNILLIIVAIVAFIAIAGVLGFIKYRQISTAIAGYENMVLPPTVVTSMTAPVEDWVSAIRAVGSATAVQGVIVSTDQAGIVEKITFESGQSVKQGDLLVQLEVSQEQAQLRSAEAQLRLAQANLQRQQNLLKGRVSAQADFDTAQAQFDEASARVLEVRALINKKTIRAPFSGVIGIRLVNLGQYLENGAKIAPLQSLDPIFVDFYVPQQAMGQISAGQEVKVRADGLPDEIFTGKINAVDSIVDEATRNVRVQATFNNPKGLLRPGMFVNAEVPLPNPQHVVVLPATAVLFAPYGDTVYIVEEMTDPKKGTTYKGVRQQVVKLGQSKGDQVAILSGVNAGEEVVTSGGFKLRQGAPVEINNSIQPANSASPTPEDT